MSTATPKVPSINSNPMCLPRIDKGVAPNKTRIFCWDLIGSCSPDCGLKPKCLYVTGVGMTQQEYDYGKRHNLCFTQKKYLDNVYDALLAPLLPEITEKQSIELGLSIMPLFGHLVKMKITEVATDIVLLTDKNGKKYANPIYREIRETIKLINQMLDSYGLGTVSDVPQFDFANGDPTYYDRMIKDEERFDGRGAKEENCEITEADSESNGKESYSEVPTSYVLPSKRGRRVLTK